MRKLLGVLLALVIVAPALAGANMWTTNGPAATGILLELALDPTRPATVYAAGSSGSGGTVTPRVFKSIDKGVTWSEVTNGVVNLAVNTLAVDPTNGLNVYVGGHNPVARSLSLYKSTDGGASWRLLGWPFSGGDLDRPVLALAIDPSNGQVVYVGTSNAILKSVDGGNTWIILAGGLPAANVLSIAIDRTSTATVYTATDAGLYKSTNGGATWSIASNGLPTVVVGGTPVPRTKQVVIDPSDPRVLYTVVAPATGGELVYRSGDAAASWAPASSGMPSDVVRDLAVDPLSPRTLYAALNGGSGQNLVRSTDAGASWSAFSLPNGGYSSAVALDGLSPQTLHVGHNDAVWQFTFVGAGTPTVTTTPLATGTPAARDGRYFVETGFRIDDDAFWDYFNRRGRLRTFGYPTSRTFTFLGFTSQFFQRTIMQKTPEGRVRLMNLLDPGLLPYTTFNGAQMPASDPALTNQAPAPGSANYDSAIQAYVVANAPNSFESLPVNFGATFRGTVTLQDAYPTGQGDPGLLPGLNLELWGVPTSRPAYDPNNRNFVYQRFQRGIMHFDRACLCTNGILLADYLKAIITGRGLPADLAAQAAASPYLRQYDATKPSWVARPEHMPGTNLTVAFEAQ